MNFQEHLKRTNGKGAEIHRFLDSYSKTYGVDHRVALHHHKGISRAVRLFGEKARSIAEQHIKDDWLGRIPVDENDENFYKEKWACDLWKFLDAKSEAENIMSNGELKVVWLNEHQAIGILPINCGQPIDWK